MNIYIYANNHPKQSNFSREHPPGPPLDPVQRPEERLKG